MISHAFRRIGREVFALAPASLQDWVRRERERKRRRVIARRNAGKVAAGQRLVPEGPLEAKFHHALFLLQQQGSTLGDYLEFGVYNGSSLACMFRALQTVGADDVRLFGFDSFEGLPAEAAHDDDGAWLPGQFSMEYEFARRFLTSQGVDWSRVHLIKGWFNETLTPDLPVRHRIRKASVIMVDCDMYLSARTALQFCAPLIEDAAVIFFDDWYSNGLHEKNLGEKRAFEEFLTEHPGFTVEDIGTYGKNSHVVMLMRE